MEIRDMIEQTTSAGEVKLPEPKLPSRMFRTGDVFQILETELREGWRGCLVQAILLDDMGLHACVYWPGKGGDDTVIHQGQASRFAWRDIEFIGAAKIISNLPRQIWGNL
jgi:hypothetical protein